MKFKDQYGVTGLGFAVYAVAGVATIMALVLGSVTAGNYYGGRASCGRFSNNTNRPTEFKRSGPLSWECYTPSDNGRWIPTSALREFGSKP